MGSFFHIFSKSKERKESKSRESKRRNKKPKNNEQKEEVRLSSSLSTISTGHRNKRSLSTPPKKLKSLTAGVVNDNVIHSYYYYYYYYYYYFSRNIYLFFLIIYIETRYES